MLERVGECGLGFGGLVVVLRCAGAFEFGAIDVNVEGGTLTIKAERTGRTEQDVQWLSSGRFTGTFMRQLSLGDGIDADAISATYANGVLTVTIPVADKAKARRIEVSAAPEHASIEAAAS
jgi:HSP20 family protein